MSVSIITRVFEQSASKGSRRVIMLAIADSADDRGVCWPSIKILANKANIDARNVRSHLSDLHDAKELLTVPRKADSGRQRSNAYIVAIGQSRDDLYHTLTTHEQIELSDDEAKQVLNQWEADDSDTDETTRGRVTKSSGEDDETIRGGDDGIDSPLTVKGNVKEPSIESDECASAQQADAFEEMGLSVSADTPAAQHLFQAINEERAVSNGWKPIKTEFPTVACKRKFVKHEQRLGVDRMKEAIDTALMKGILKPSSITNYAAKWDTAPSQNDKVLNFSRSHKRTSRQEEKEKLKNRTIVKTLEPPDWIKQGASL